MQKIQLGRTGLTVSRAALGTMTFGDQTDRKTAFRMMDFCLEHGINFFDTANVYNDGQSEKIIGEWLPGMRDKVVLASKVGIRAGDGPDERGLSRAAIRKGIEGSLNRLGVDYLDVYYLHTPDYETPMDETLEALNTLVGEGKVRAVGASNYASWQLCRLLWIADMHDLPTVKVVQPMYNLLSRGIEQEFIPCCREFGIPMVVYNPLAGGLLTGKHEHDAAVSGSRFDGNEQYRDRYWHRDHFEAVEKLTIVAQEAGISLVELAIRWLRRHSQADVLIIGASRFEHLAENLEACEKPELPERVVSECDRVWQRLKGVSPVYNR